MNSPIHVQLVKWTIPVVAFVTAFFWYKRRRIDRGEVQWNDPGGIAKSNHEKETVLSDTKGADASLHDSGVQEIGQSSISHCHTRQEEPTRVPRKVSESMDIPMKNSMSHSSFCNNGQIGTCEDIEMMCQTNVQLGSNPNASYFDMIARNQNAPSEADNSIDRRTRIFQDNADEKEQSLHNRETEPSGQKYTVDECKEDGQQAGEHTVKTEGQEVEERDSANHSPVSGVLEGSVTDEARSEGSNTDSGKGGSINGCRKDTIVPSIYDFAIPQHLVGRLIGRHGCFLHSIRTKADVGIYVNDHPYDGDHKICSIRGSVEGINAALKMIRQKFPEKRFPQVTLTEISAVPEVNDITYNIPLIRSLSLVEGVSNDINISHIVKPNWLFVHLPTHPTYPHLQNLEDSMTVWYNSQQLPSMPDVLNKGDYVAVYWSDKWVRGCIEKPDPSGEKTIVRLVDHGGYWQLSNSQFKPLVLNYLGWLPFQAIEIFIANIQPKDGKWTSEAYNSVHAYSTNGVLQAHIAGHMANNVYTNIYISIQNYGLISLADDLLSRGHAEHVEWENMKPETIESICTQEL